jgi:hypothetical protein
MVAVKPGLNFFGTLDIHDGGAMYSQEVSRIRFLLKLGEGLTEFMFTISDVKTYVVAFSFDPVHVFRRDKKYASVLGNRLQIRMFPFCRGPLQAGYDPAHFIVIELASYSLLGASESAFKPQADWI